MSLVNASKILLTYLFVGMLWIIFSDQIVETLFHDQHHYYQTYKGIAFIIITGIFFYFALRRREDKIDKTKEDEKLFLGFMSDKLPLYVMIADVDKKIVFANRLVSKLKTQLNVSTYEQLIEKIDSSNIATTNFTQLFKSNNSKWNQLNLKINNKSIATKWKFVLCEDGRTICIGEDISESIKRDNENLLLFETFRRSRDPLFVLEAENFKPMYLSESYIEHFGKDKQELVGRSNAFLFSPYNINTFEEYAEHIKKGGSGTCEFYTNTPNGTKIVELSLNYLSSSTKPTLSGYLKDVTHKKEAEEELNRINSILAEQNQQLEIEVTQRKEAETIAKKEKLLTENIIETANTIFLLLDGIGTIINLNQFTANLLGVEKKDVIGRNWVHNFLPEEIRQPILNAFQVLWQNGSVGDFKHNENDVLTTDGRRLNIHWQNTILLNDKGESEYLISFGVNVTELYHTRSELNENKARLLMAIENGDIGLWDWNLVTGEIYFNEKWFTLFGYDVGEIENSIEGWYSIVHPDDLIHTRIALEKHISGELPSYEARLRMKDKSGQYVWSIDKGRVVEFDNEGKAKRLIGIQQNIHRTEIVKMEALEKSALINTIFNNAAESMIFLDKELNVIYSNHSAVVIFHKLTGLNDIGCNFHNILKEEVYEIFNTLVIETTKSGFYTIIKEIELDKNLRYFRVAMSMVYGTNKELIGYLLTGFDITNLKNTQKEIENVKNRLSAATKSSNLGIWEYDFKSNLLYYDDIMYELYEIPKTILPKELPYLNEKLFHPDDIDLINSFIGEIVATKQTKSIEYRIINKLGIIRYFKTSAVPSFIDGEVSSVIGCVMEITNDKRKELEIKRTNKALSDFRNALYQTTIVSFTDKNGTITNINDNLCKVSGYTRSEIIGENQSMFNSGQHSDSFFIELWGKLQQGQVWRGEIRNKSKDGSFYWLDKTIIPLKEDNVNVSGFLDVSVEITKRKQVQQELQLLNVNLEKMVEERTNKLITLNKEKDDLLGMVSHDLKNPLAGIQLMADIARVYAREIGSDKIITKMDNIETSIVHMTNIIANLLEINRLETGAAMFYPEEFSIGEVIDSVITQNHDRAESKLQTFEVNIENYHEVIKYDKNKVTQIIDNLLNNAVKYAPSNSKIKINSFNVSENNRHFVQFDVIDYGQGIHENEIPKVFEKFTKLSSVPTGGENSTGLGLSIVKKMIDVMGGQIHCESKKNVETKFTIKLPINV